MFTLDAELGGERWNFNKQKTKSEIKKELENSIAPSNKNKNTDIEQIAKNYTESEKDAAKIIHKFKEIIKNKQSDILWLAYHQGIVFQMFRSKEQFVSNMVLKFKVSKSLIVFKITLSKLIDDYKK